MISVTVLTKNAEETLASCLKALRKFNEVIVIDTGSTDLTLDIARTFPNVRLFELPFRGFGTLHNIAAEKTSHDWVLSIDSDEILTEALAREILALKPTKGTVYSLPFLHYFNGKRIRGSGRSPESHVRLYNKNETRFTDDSIDEEVLVRGAKKRLLRHPLKHYSYRSISDFLHKMQLYSTLFAKQNKGKTRVSFSGVIRKSLFAFFKSYVLQRGFLDGKEGVILSAYDSHIAFYKHLKLIEANRNALHSPLPSER
ncbi:MAG: glycosyltransferase family 2 protein [Simkaniaceae bacterium]|nr:glycosyltransferase family 2 protein [Simkaniaceae bacterium]